MRHRHVGDPMKLCSGCFPEMQELQKELRTRRVWAWILVGFSFALAVVVAFVLYRLGPLGR